MPFSPNWSFDAPRHVPTRNFQSSSGEATAGGTKTLYIRALSPETMGITFQATGIVRATREETFAWWTDLREDDAGHVMPPLRRRSIVKKTVEETVTEDRWSIFGFPMRTRATLRPRAPDGWEVTSELRGGTARDIVRLTTVPEGTRVTMELVMDLRWPWSWAARALRPALARLFQKDLEAVNRSLEASLHRAERPSFR